LLAVSLLALSPLFAQLPAPNTQGISIRHHLMVSNVEATKKCCRAMGAQVNANRPPGSAAKRQRHRHAPKTRAERSTDDSAVNHLASL
jgi:hypothetical protein